MLRRYILPKYVNIRQKGLLEQIDNLCRTQYYSESELKALQEEKLRRLISHAYQNTPFYRHLFNKIKIKPHDIRTIEDLHKLPILSKSIVRENMNNLIIRNNEKISFRKTSGSTGIPLRICTNRDARLIEQALFYRFLFNLGYQWGDSTLTIWGGMAFASGLSKLRKKISRMLFNGKFVDAYRLSDDVIESTLMYIKNNPPKILEGYASAVYLLALEAMRRNIQVKIPIVLTSAEILFSFQRKIIEEAFKAQVFNFYGCGEVNSIAFECVAHNGLHVASEHVILEILDDGGRPTNDTGRVVITNLDNYAMPLIRYENGDLAKWKNGKCTCGCATPRLEKLEGRVYDFIEGPNGVKVHAAFFARCIIGELDFARKYFIKEFRIIQKEIDNLCWEFVTSNNNEIAIDDINKLKTKTKEYLGDMKIEIKYVKGIPTTKMGKRMFVFSILNKERGKLHS